MTNEGSSRGSTGGSLTAFRTPAHLQRIPKTDPLMPAENAATAFDSSLKQLAHTNHDEQPKNSYLLTFKYANNMLASRSLI